MYEFADGIFVEESEVRFYGFRVQTRMAVVRLSGRHLLVYSPVSLSPLLRSELDRLGSVSFVVSPNKIHNLTLSEYRDSYPKARFYAPPGLPERRPDLTFDGVLPVPSDARWQQDLDYVLTEGNVFFSEVLFLHRRSRTLLVGDFVENFTSETASSWARAIGALWGVRSRPMASPEFRFYTHDAEAAAGALDRAGRWDFERIFLCHGRLITAEAKEVFQKVCGDLLDEVRTRGRLTCWAWRQIARVQ